MPRSKRLLSDARSNVLVYLTGHGGDEFLKFQDQVRCFLPHESPFAETVPDAVPGHLEAHARGAG